MLHKVKGIVFRFTKYGETSIIVTIFTDHLGLQTYIVNGIRNKGSQNKIALYQPLTLLEMVVYYRETANINRIKEVKCFYAYKTLYNDIVKSSIAMFINEVLNKVVREESHANELCDFLISSLISLDTISENVNNFHLVFLLKLSRFLGFGAQNVNEVLGWRLTDTAIESAIQKMLDGDYAQKILLTNDQRRELLALIIDFYNEQTGMLGEIKSLQVLKEILM